VRENKKLSLEEFLEKLRPVVDDVIIFLSVGLAAFGLVTSILFGTSKAALLLGVIGGVILGVLTLVGLSFLPRETLKTSPLTLSPLLVVGLSILLSSWVIWPGQGEFVVFQQREALWISQEPSLKPPYFLKISYLGSFTLQTKADLLLPDKKKISWQVKGRLKFLADYQKTFNLLKRFGGVKELQDQVRKIFKAGVQDYLSKNLDSAKDLPTNFEFDLAPSFKEKLRELGYEVEKLRAERPLIILLLKKEPEK
jgi:hypothetical protein